MGTNSLDNQDLNQDDNKDEQKAQKPVMTEQEALQKAQEFEGEIVAMGGSAGSIDFYISELMKGTLEKELVRESVRMQMDNENSIKSLASKYHGQVITPALIYKENSELLNRLLYGKVGGGNASAVDSISARQILEDLFEKVGIPFEWENIDLRKFEVAKQQHLDFKQSADSLKGNLKIGANGKISMIDIWRTDKRAFVKLLSHLKDNKEDWKMFLKEYMPEYVGKISLDNFKFDEKNVEVKSILGQRLRNKAQGYSKITPFGIFRKDKSLYKTLHSLFGNNKAEWMKFLKEYVGEDIAKKFKFSPVDLRAVEKKERDDKLLKPLAGRLRTLIALVESKEGKGGTITPETIYKYGRKYNINIYPALVNVIGSNKSKWNRFFHKFVSSYSGRFSFRSFSKGKVEGELNNAEKMKKLGSSLKTLIDSKGAGEVTTKSIFKYAPGLFQKIEGILGKNSTVWKNFIKTHVGASYANRFFYVSFSKNDVYQEKKISALHNAVGGKLEGLCRTIDKDTINLSDIKSRNPALYFQLIANLGTDKANWQRYIKKTLSPNLWNRFLIESTENTSTFEEGSKDDPYHFMIKHIHKMRIDMSKMHIPTVLKPQFFADNFPEEFKILNREIKNQKNKWQMFIHIYFPKLEGRFLWKQIEDIEDAQETENDEKIDEDKDYRENLKEEDRMILEAYSAILGDLLKKQFEKDKDGFSIESFIKGNNVLIKNIQNIIGPERKILIKYILDICHMSGITEANITKIDFVEPPDIEDKIREKILEVMTLRLEEIIFDLTRDKDQISMQDLYDRDPKLFLELQEYLEEQDISMKDYIENNLSSIYRSKIIFGEVERDENMEDENTDISQDIFDEKKNEDYNKEKMETLTAVKSLLKEELEDKKDANNLSVEQDSHKLAIEENISQEITENKVDEQKIPDFETETIVLDKQDNVDDTESVIETQEEEKSGTDDEPSHIVDNKPGLRIAHKEEVEYKREDINEKTDESIDEEIFQGEGNHSNEIRLENDIDTQADNNEIENTEITETSNEDINYQDISDDDTEISSEESNYQDIPEEPDMVESLEITNDEKEKFEQQESQNLREVSYKDIEQDENTEERIGDENTANVKAENKYTWENIKILKDDETENFDDTIPLDETADTIDKKQNINEDSITSEVNRIPMEYSVELEHGTEPEDKQIKPEAIIQEEFKHVLNSKDSEEIESKGVVETENSTEKIEEKIEIIKPRENILGQNDKAQIIHTEEKDDENKEETSEEDNKENTDSPSLVDTILGAGIMTGTAAVEYIKEKKEERQEKIESEEAEKLKEEELKNEKLSEQAGKEIIQENEKSMEVLTTTLEDLIEKNIQNFERMDLNWLYRQDAQLFDALKNKLANNEVELKKLLQKKLIEFKHKYLKRTENIKFEQESFKEKRIIEEEEELIEKIDQDREEEEEEEEKAKKANLEALIRECISTHNVTNKGKEIDTICDFQVNISEKRAKYPDTITDTINQNFRKLFQIGGNISMSHIKLLDYSEYLNTALCNLKFEIHYSLAGIENEKNMWKFSLNNVSLEEI